MTVSGVTGSSSSMPSATSDAQSIAGNFDTFLQLLTTQLKNQNPLDPLDTNQFTQQLVRVLGRRAAAQDQRFPVEPRHRQRQHRQLQCRRLYRQDRDRARASAPSSPTARRPGTSTSPTDASVKVNIKDANGNSVYTESGSMQAGSGVFNWDGTDSAGQHPARRHLFDLDERLDANGQTVNVSTQSQRRRHRRRLHRLRAGAADRQHAGQSFGRHLGSAAVVTLHLPCRGAAMIWRNPNWKGALAPTH